MMRVLLLAVVALAGCKPAAQAPVERPAEPAAPTSEVQASSAPAPPATDTDTDQDGVPDMDDLCPTEAMAMGAACADDPSKKRGCPDDCRAPTPVP